MGASALIGSLLLLTSVVAPSAVDSGTAGASPGPIDETDADGELVLVGDDSFVRLPADAPSGGGPDAPARLAVGSGYAVLPGIGGYARSSFTIVLAASPGIEQLRPAITRAANLIGAEAGLSVTVAAGLSPDRPPSPGEVVVRIAGYSPCGPLFSSAGVIGCGGPDVDRRGGIIGGEVWLAPGLECVDVGESVLAHELGHAFGLAHTEQRVDGLLQLMYPSTTANAPSFRAGDRAGLRAVAGQAQTLAVTDPPPAPRSPQQRTSGSPGGPVPVATTTARTTATNVGSLFSQPAVSRVLDTRSGVGLGGTFGPEQTRTLSLAGLLGATQADAVVLNLTATGATSAGFLTASPGGTARPSTSSANYTLGSDAANLVVVGLGPGNTVDLYNSGATVDVVADLFGVFSAAGTFGYVARPPTRILDTRVSDVPGEQGFPLGCLAALPADDGLLAAAGIPDDYAAAVVNLTAIETTAAGYLSVLGDDWFGDLPAAPSTSNLNVAANDTRANLAVTDGASWSVANGPGLLAAVVADLAGWFIAPQDDPTAARYLPVTPTRVLDTRVGIGSSGPFATDSSRAVALPLPPLAAPAAATAVVVNVTAVESNAAGYLTLSPSGSARPNASNVNYDAGEAVPNLAIVKIGAGGSIDVFAATGNPQVIVDVVGYFVGG